MIRTSVVIPTYNRAYFLGDCLDALIHQDISPDEYEIIVVDDGSPDNTREITNQYIQNHPKHHIIYINQANAGPSAARNNGWRHGRGEIIAFIDDDCIASPQWVREISSGYEQPDVAGSCGNVQPVELDNIITQCLTFEKLHQVPFLDNYEQIFYPITCNASFRKSILELVNGFDETFPYAGGEDVDLGIRIRKKGFFFIDNRNAIIKHYHKDTYIGMVKTWYRYGIGGAQWKVKNHLGLTVEENNKGVMLWFFIHPSIIKPISELLKQGLSIQYAPFRIIHNLNHGATLINSIVFFYLQYSRNTISHIGQWIGYRRYRSSFK